MEKDAKLNDFIRLKQVLPAPVERWQMIPTSRTALSSDADRKPVLGSPLQQISTNILGNSQPKTPESNRLVIKYKKTPKTRGKSSPFKTPPRKSKTPTSKYKTPKSGKTPGGKNNKTPSSCRYIPSRVTTDVEYSSFLIQQKERNERGGNDDGDELSSPTIEEYHQELLSALSRSRGQQQRGVLSFKPSTPSASSSTMDYLVTENASEAGGSICGSRNKSTKPSLPITADKILDAPTLVDDYYLNNLDWGKNNYVAIGLGFEVYLWSASDGSVRKLMEMSGEGEYVSSVSWSGNGKFLAIGGSNAAIQLWDVEKEKRIRQMKGHLDRVGVMTWNRHTLTSGSRDGMILYNDVRKQNHVVGKSCYHRMDVCGLKWSPDGSKLASGANDNLVCIWNNSNPSEPAQVLKGHKSAIKAVSWCPWQRNTLATGGGSNDKTIRFWNTFNGQCLNVVDAKSQVSSLGWNQDHQQLISSHGYPKNNMVIWQYPCMTRLKELSGHSGRILHMCLSPRRSRVASAGGDETLRIWKCFEKLRHNISQQSYNEDSIVSLLNSFS